MRHKDYNERNTFLTEHHSCPGTPLPLKTANLRVSSHFVRRQLTAAAQSREIRELCHVSFVIFFFPFWNKKLFFFFKTFIAAPRTTHPDIMPPNAGRKVYVVGVGMTKFEKPGRRNDFDYPVRVPLVWSFSFSLMPKAGDGPRGGDQGARGRRPQVRQGRAGRRRLLLRRLDVRSARAVPDWDDSGVVRSSRRVPLGLIPSRSRSPS